MSLACSLAPETAAVAANGCSPSANPILCAQLCTLVLGRYALKAIPEAVWRRKPLPLPPTAACLLPTQSCAPNFVPWSSAVTH